MTREEREKHLDWLYRLKSEIFVFMPKEWLIPMADALDDAIKTLEQEPTTKNIVDCVSRQFMFELGATCIATRNENGELIALGAIEELPSVTPQNIDYKAQYERLSQKAEIVISQLRADRDRLMSLPSVTPKEPRKGHWIKSNIGGAKVCSICNAHIGLSSFKFCPNCGAKMVEEQGENT